MLRLYLHYFSSRRPSPRIMKLLSIPNQMSPCHTYVLRFLGDFINIFSLGFILLIRPCFTPDMVSPDGSSFCLLWSFTSKWMSGHAHSFYVIYGNHPLLWIDVMDWNLYGPVCCYRRSIIFFHLLLLHARLFSRTAPYIMYVPIGTSKAFLMFTTIPPLPPHSTLIIPHFMHKCEIST